MRVCHRSSKSGIQAFVLDERRPFDFKPMKALREVVIAFRPDIVQSHNVKSHLFMRLLGLYRDYPWIAFNHGYTTRDLRDRFYNQFDGGHCAPPTALLRSAGSLPGS